VELLKEDYKDYKDNEYNQYNQKDKDNMDYKDYALLLKALGDETRIKIFDRLTEGEQCACMLLEEVAISQPTLSYHMKILCDCGLVIGRRDGIWMRYTINPNTLARLQEFFNSIRPAFQEPDLLDCEGIWAGKQG